MRISPIERSPNWTIDQSGLTATKLNTSIYDGLRTTEGFSSGKWYWEGKHISDGGTASGFGVVLSSADMKITYGNNIVTAGVNHKYYFRSGVLYNPQVNGNNTIANGDIIGIALDLDDSSGTVQWYKNGVKQPQSFIGLKSLGATWYPAFMAFNASSIEFRFTKETISYPIPDGYRQAENYNKFLISSGDEYYSITNKYKDNAIPAMTSNITPSGVVDASSTYTTFYPWKAFDRIVDPNGWVANINVLTGWLSYEFDSPKIISAYSIQAGNTPVNRPPKTWTFEGWDGSEWVLLDSRMNEPNFAGEEYRLYEFKNKVAYKRYRINVTANQGAGDFLAIGDLGMYELDKYISSVDNSETSFLEHGMNKGMIIDLEDEFSERRSLVKVSEKIGLGKVFKQKIDTSKTPIKRASIT